MDRTGCKKVPLFSNCYFPSVAFHATTVQGGFSLVGRWAHSLDVLGIHRGRCLTIHICDSLKIFSILLFHDDVFCHRRKDYVA